MSFTFTVPGEPVAFRRAGRNGKFSFTPKEQASYMNLIKVLAADHMRKSFQKIMSGALHVSVSVQYPWPKSQLHEQKMGRLKHSWKTSKPDIDNLSKIVFDALNGVLWLDDAQVASMTCTKTYADKGSTLVSVSPL